MARRGALAEIAGSFTTHWNPAMNDDIPIDSGQLDSLLQARGWSRGQLLERPGIAAAALEQAEARGAAPAALACAVASALDASPAMLHGASPQAQAGRRKAWCGIAIGLGVLFVMSVIFGYQAGSDRAKRDNYRDCVAAGGLDCVRG